jgi:hypothetical protein
LCFFASLKIPEDFLLEQSRDTSVSCDEEKKEQIFSVLVPFPEAKIAIFLDINIFFKNIINI